MGKTDSPLKGMLYTLCNIYNKIDKIDN
ncbi:hypothetical protein FOXB_15817 [Fusarium oxysporum f. sp. conglutinans Fo5176]|uniref:Uncharacterized protein n=1 Tax=Fusarium oxysporum (strain Fo5176) TaxID=660025 RepID=F9GAY4_FUSOF|nr:hypothetical protein FOXB_15817 [Fusarium oxysporum f. sp. conglutinans Fo5176]